MRGPGPCLSPVSIAVRRWVCGLKSENGRRRERERRAGPAGFPSPAARECGRGGRGGGFGIAQFTHGRRACPPGAKRLRRPHCKGSARALWCRSLIAVHANSTSSARAGCTQTLVLLLSRLCSSLTKSQWHISAHSLPFPGRHVIPVVLACLATSLFGPQLNTDGTAPACPHSSALAI